MYFIIWNIIKPESCLYNISVIKEIQRKGSQGHEVMLFIVKTVIICFVWENKGTETILVMFVTNFSLTKTYLWAV